MKIILLDEREARGKNRVEQAEELIRIHPNDAPERNTWLFQFGISEEAQMIRANTNPSVDYNVMWRKCGTGSLNIPALSESQVKRIMDIVDENPKN